MEWALSASRRELLGRIKNPWGGSGEYPPARKAVERLFGEIKFTRLYFGQEFCEKLLPPAEEMEEALSESGNNSLSFSLVTPYVTECGLKRLETLLGGLVKIHPRCEVIANDWGTLYLLKNKFPSLTPVMGRLLNKACRDPRLTDYLEAEPGSQPAGYRRHSASNPHMRRLLKTLGVERVETDNLPQGADDSLPGLNYHVSLYIPCGFIATGRICLTGSWGLEKGNKFRTGRQCSRMCLHYTLKMSDLSNQVKNGSGGGSIFQKGNTVFYNQPEDLLVRGLKASPAAGVDRIIYQPVHM